MVGGIEQTLTLDTWRNPSPVTASYLTTLAGWGYPLCPVERIAALLGTTSAGDETTADTSGVTDGEPDGVGKEQQAPEE